MPRYFAPITIEELKDRVKKCFSELVYPNRIVDKLYKDLKVNFDTENFGMDDDVITGYHTLPSGLTFLGLWAGGDWELPVTFIVYWDGKKLRGYVPDEGNLWNKKTKEAYGNDWEADLKDAKRRWPDCVFSEDEDDDVYCFPNQDDGLMLNDIQKRILPRK